MCSYCGCLSIPVIATFVAEHEQIADSTGVLRRAAQSGDAAATHVAGKTLAAQLEPHTLSEERSIFAELRTDPEFADHVATLCDEHREIAALLARVSAGDLPAAPELERLLRDHLDKEENGLFPAAAIALSGDAWERVTATAGGHNELNERNTS